MPDLRIRLAAEPDAEAIRAIYNPEVLTATSTFDLVPRSLAEQRAWLVARSGAFSAVVAVDGDDVVGFASLSPYKERAAYRTTVEDSVYVARDRNGQGDRIAGRPVRVRRPSGRGAPRSRSGPSSDRTGWPAAGSGGCRAWRRAHS